MPDSAADGCACATGPSCGADGSPDRLLIALARVDHDWPPGSRALRDISALLAPASCRRYRTGAAGYGSSRPVMYAAANPVRRSAFPGGAVIRAGRGLWEATLPSWTPPGIQRGP